MVLVCGEMFQTAQCVNSPPGASGSSTLKTTFFASVGISAICKGGLVFGPSHEYFGGIFAPCWKAELVIYTQAPRAANEAISTSKLADGPSPIACRLVRPCV